MSECEHIFRLGAYHDGEMSASSAAEMERHLQDCPVCAAELARLRALSPLLASAGRGDLSPEAMNRLHRKIDLMSSAGIRRTAEMLAAAAAVILVVCSTWLTSLSASSESAQPIPLWEITAVSQADRALSTESTEQQLATWTVQDLSWKNNHD